MSCLRVEFTVLDDKLLTEKLASPSGEFPSLVHSIRYSDASNPPFPEDGKEGLAVYVGRLESFSQPKVRLLWELEKRRGRATMIVVTSLRGRGFIPAMQTLETELADQFLVPVCFLRRRKKSWDSIDAFSPGESPSMEGAHIRIKRLKQRAWEELVDRLTLVNESIKETYFRDLHVARETLLAAMAQATASRSCSPVVGTAGECLNSKNLFSLLQQPQVAQLIGSIPRSVPDPDGRWLFLGKRGDEELILWSNGNQRLKEGVVLSAEGEFAVAKIRQRIDLGGELGSAYRLKVDWRYPPGREISSLWGQKAALPAGADQVDG